MIVCRRIVSLFFFLVFAFSAMAQTPEMILQIGHGSTQIADAAITPDNRYVLTGSSDDTLKVWDTQNGKEIRTIPCGFAIESLFPLADSQTVIIIGTQGIEIRNIFSGELLANSTMFPSCFDLAENGDMVYYDMRQVGTIRYVHQGGQEGGTPINGKAGMISCIAINEEGTRALSGSLEGIVTYWDLPNQRVIFQTAIHEGSLFGVTAVDISPDGRTAITTGMDGTINYWNLDSGRILFTNRIETQGAMDLAEHYEEGDSSYDTAKQAYNGIHSASFSQDGSYFTTGGADGNIRIWSSNSGIEASVLEGHQGWVTSVKFTFGDSRLLSSSNDRSVRLWDLEQRREISVMGGAVENITVMEPSFESDMVAYADSRGVSILNLRNGLLTRRLEQEWIHSLSIPFGGSHLFSFNNARLYMDSTSNNDLAESFSLEDLELPNALAHGQIGDNPEKPIMLVADTEHFVHFIDLAVGEPMVLGQHNAAIRDLAISFNGERGFTCSEDGSVIAWDLVNQVPLGVFEGHEEQVQALDCSHNGEYVLSGGFDDLILLWNSRTGEILRALEGQPGIVSSVALSDDGSFALSGGWDNTIILWDLMAGREIRRFTDHRGWITDVAFLPGQDYSMNSTHFLSASNDGTLRIWNLETGEYVAFLESQDGQEWLCFDNEGYWNSSPNGGELVAMVLGNDIWNIDQFALQNNRPDLILAKLPNPDQEQIDHYFNLYQRRLRRMGLEEQDLTGQYHFPEVEIVDYYNQGRDLTLDFQLSDSRYNLISYNIFVNDVPIYGEGKAVHQRRLNLRETIPLNSGVNKVEVSCINAQGVESYRALVQVDYQEEILGDLYYIGFGVSDYADPELNLQYAHKDAFDLAFLFGEMGGQGFDDVIINIYTDEVVTLGNVRHMKSILQQANPEDTVVLFIAGHGVYDVNDQATYYYLGHYADTDNLAATAIPFEELEAILQGIPPRNKLFLMDTCESGELDQDNLGQVYSLADSRGIQPRALPESRGLRRSGQVSAPPARNFLQERNSYIYNDLLRRSGAIVFSSSRGHELSYESTQVENGFFTENILRAFSDHEADQNQDGMLSMNELQAYVSRGVAQDTQGMQNPTVDRDNLYMDFAFPQ